MPPRAAEASPPPQGCAAPPKTPAGTETLVFIRHGEKTKEERGQLCCAGQNRALLLPDVLLKKFGTPAQVYAPNPSTQICSKGTCYYYIRPLATIEPTAIKCAKTVNTQIGYTDVTTLQSTLVTSANMSSLIFVAWEHVNIGAFTKNMFQTYGLKTSVPTWNDDDYDSIYVFTIVTPANGSTPTLTFTIDHEGLNGRLAPQCASAPPWPQLNKETSR